MHDKRFYKQPLNLVILLLVEFLLDNGSKMDNQDASVKTALNYAACYCKNKLFVFFLKDCATTNVANVLEQIVLDYANVIVYNEITGLLMEFCAKINAVQNGKIITMLNCNIKNMKDTRKL